jgi:hypothetical protein
MLSRTVIMENIYLSTLLSNFIPSKGVMAEAEVSWQPHRYCRLNLCGLCRTVDNYSVCTNVEMKRRDQTEFKYVHTVLHLISSFQKFNILYKLDVVQLC